MFSTGDEFELEIDGYTEYYNCIGEYLYQGIEYLICENEFGIKKVLYYSSDYVGDEEDSLTHVDDEELEEEILDSFQENMYKSEEKSFSYWEEENDFDDDIDNFSEDVMDDLEIHDEDEMDFIQDYSYEDIDLDDFIDGLLEDEDFEEDEN